MEGTTGWKEILDSKEGRRKGRNRGKSACLKDRWKGEKRGRREEVLKDKGKKDEWKEERRKED